MCRKFECRKGIHYKTQTGTSCEKCNSNAFRLGIELASSGLLDQCSTTELQMPLPTTWARVQYIYIYIYTITIIITYNSLDYKYNYKYINKITIKLLLLLSL